MLPLRAWLKSLPYKHSKHQYFSHLKTLTSATLKVPVNLSISDRYKKGILPLKLSGQTHLNSVIHAQQGVQILVTKLNNG